MKQYLLSVYQPDGDPPPSVDLERIRADLDALREEMQEAGAWVFASGLHPASTATVVRVSDGETLITDGPYTERPRATAARPGSRLEPVAGRLRPRASERRTWSRRETGAGR